jgi:hypothetical protein
MEAQRDLLQMTMMLHPPRFRRYHRNTSPHQIPHPSDSGSSPPSPHNQVDLSRTSYRTNRFETSAHRVGGSDGSRAYRGRGKHRSPSPAFRPYGRAVHDQIANSPRQYPASLPYRARIRGENSGTSTDSNARRVGTRTPNINDTPRESRGEPASGSLVRQEAFGRRRQTGIRDNEGVHAFRSDLQTPAWKEDVFNGEFNSLSLQPPATVLFVKQHISVHSPLPS